MAAADETTENFAEVMNEALADAAKAEAERDALAARVAEWACPRGPRGGVINEYFATF